MSEVFNLRGFDVPMMQNVLMWDVVEREWVVGHARQVIEGVDPYLCACTVAEAHELITDGVPVPVFEDVSHWARLPGGPG